MFNIVKPVIPNHFFKIYFLFKMLTFVTLIFTLVALNTNFSVVTLQQSSDDLVIGNAITFLLILLTGSFDEVIKSSPSDTIKEVLGNNTANIVNKLAEFLSKNVFLVSLTSLFF